MNSSFDLNVPLGFLWFAVFLWFFLSIPKLHSRRYDRFGPPRCILYSPLAHFLPSKCLKPRASGFHPHIKVCTPQTPFSYFFGPHVIFGFFILCLTFSDITFPPFGSPLPSFQHLLAERFFLWSNRCHPPAFTFLHHIVCFFLQNSKYLSLPFHTIFAL